MSSNQFRSTQYVLNVIFNKFFNECQLIKTSNRGIQDNFQSERYATGRTLNYRLMERYIVGKGATAEDQARVQVIRPLSITDQFHVMINQDGFELKFDRAADKPYIEMATKPIGLYLANAGESFLAEAAQTASYMAVGTPGVAVSFDTLLAARGYMVNMAIPQDGEWYGALDVKAGQAISSDLKGSYNNTVNRDALMRGFIDNLVDLKLFETVFLKRHISGAGEAGGSPPAGFKLGGTVVGPVVGGNVINVTGLIADSIVFRKGDIIEVDDAAECYMINPLTRNHFGQRAQLVVTEDVLSDNTGAAVVPVSMDGPIITDIEDASRNLSAPIPNGAQLLLRDDHNVSLAYHRDALVFAAPPMYQLDGGVVTSQTTSDVYKLSLTMTRGSDVKNYKQRDRTDFIAGRAINSSFMVRICH